MSIMNLSSSRMIQHSLPRRLLHNHSGVVSIALFFVFCCVVFSLITSNFLTGTNWLNIIRQSAPLLIVATAMTLVITTGGIDLSVGSTLALVGALSAIALNNWGLPWPVVLLGGLLLGGLVGAINGFFIAYEGIPAFIVTLATLAVVRGIALLVTQGYSIPVPADSLFTFIGRAWVVGIPMPALIGIMILLIGHIVLNHMRFGRYVTAIGANAEGARRSGINTKAVTMKVYIISGMAAALAGMIITARLGSGSSNQGEGFELQVIAAVVLGSTSLFGGFGTIIGTLLGAVDCGDSERADPVAYFAVLHPDSHRHHYPAGDLAEHPHSQPHALRGKRIADERINFSPPHSAAAWRQQRLRDDGARPAAD